MLYALCLVHGALLGQAPTSAAPPAPVVTFLQPLAVDEPQTKMADGPTPAVSGEATAEQQPAEPPEAAKFSIFSRPWFADRNGLSFVFGGKPGQFSVIDWESRPNGDRYWWLGRWPVPEDVQLCADLGFNIHWWSGPAQDGSVPAPNLPPQVFDLYLDLSWSQRWSERLTSEVRVRPGLYTDFRTTPPDAFRVPGEAVGVYQIDPDLCAVGGVQYLQRVGVKLLPIGGLLWQPTPRWEISMIFPEPKIAYELSAKQHLWGYVAAEYGGGSWTFKDDTGNSERRRSQ